MSGSASTEACAPTQSEDRAVRAEVFRVIAAIKLCPAPEPSSGEGSDDAPAVQDTRVLTDPLYRLFLSTDTGASVTVLAQLLRQPAYRDRSPIAEAILLALTNVVGEAADAGAHHVLRVVRHPERFGVGVERHLGALAAACVRGRSDSSVFSEALRLCGRLSHPRLWLESARALARAADTDDGCAALCEAILRRAGVPGKAMPISVVTVIAEELARARYDGVRVRGLCELLIHWLSACGADDASRIVGALAAMFSDTPTVLAPQHETYVRVLVSSCLLGDGTDQRTELLYDALYEQLCAPGAIARLYANCDHNPLGSDVIRAVLTTCLTVITRTDDPLMASGIRRDAALHLVWAACVDITHALGGGAAEDEDEDEDGGGGSSAARYRHELWQAIEQFNAGSRGPEIIGLLAGAVGGRRTDDPSRAAAAAFHGIPALSRDALTAYLTADGHADVLRAYVASVPLAGRSIATAFADLALRIDAGASERVLDAFAAHCSRELNADAAQCAAQVRFLAGQLLQLMATQQTQQAAPGSVARHLPAQPGWAAAAVEELYAILRPPLLSATSRSVAVSMAAAARRPARKTVAARAEDARAAYDTIATIVAGTAARALVTTSAGDAHTASRASRILETLVDACARLDASELRDAVVSSACEELTAAGSVVAHDMAARVLRFAAWAVADRRATATKCLLTVACVWCDQRTLMAQLGYETSRPGGRRSSETRRQRQLRQQEEQQQKQNQQSRRGLFGRVADALSAVLQGADGVEPAASAILDAPATAAPSDRQAPPLELLPPERDPRVQANQLLVAIAGALAATDERQVAAVAAHFASLAAAVDCGPARDNVVAAATFVLRMVGPMAIGTDAMERAREWLGLGQGRACAAACALTLCTAALDADRPFEAARLLGSVPAQELGRADLAAAAKGALDRCARHDAATPESAALTVAIAQEIDVSSLLDVCLHAARVCGDRIDVATATACAWAARSCTDPDARQLATIAVTLAALPARSFEHAPVREHVMAALPSLAQVCADRDGQTREAALLVGERLSALAATAPDNGLDTAVGAFAAGAARTLANGGEATDMQRALSLAVRSALARPRDEDALTAAAALVSKYADETTDARSLAAELDEAASGRGDGMRPANDAWTHIARLCSGAPAERE